MRPWRFEHFRKTRSDQLWQEGYVQGVKAIALAFGIPIEPLIEHVESTGTSAELLARLKKLLREME